MPRPVERQRVDPIKTAAVKPSKSVANKAGASSEAEAGGTPGTEGVESPESETGEAQRSDIVGPPEPNADISPELPTRPGALDNKNWISLYQHLHPGGITGNIMAHCVIDRVAEGSLHLCLDSTQSAVFSEEHRSRIEQLLADYFQRMLALSIEIGEPACESPAAFSQRIKREQIEQLRNRFQQDDNVKKLVETFSGEILQETISPV